MWPRVLARITGQPHPSDGEGGRHGVEALARHLSWQERLLNRVLRSGSADRVRFLVLRPGDAYTICSAVGVNDLIGKCRRAAPPKGVNGRASRSASEHWDTYMLRGRDGHFRPVPGLGNVMLSVVSAAAMAVASQRVLLIENYTVAAHSLGPPLSDLLLEHSAWRPFIDRLQASGVAEDWFAAHDNSSAFEQLCATDLRHAPASPLLRVFSNLYFLPTLLLNKHHAAQLNRLAETPLPAPAEFGRAAVCAARRADGVCMHGTAGLWGPALRLLFRPRQHIVSSADGYTSQLAGATTVGVHVRSALGNGAALSELVSCASRRLSAANATVLLVATMHTRASDALKTALQRASHPAWRVVRFGTPPELQGASEAHLDAAVLDLLLLARADFLLLTRGSTFGYVAHGLGGAPAAVVGAQNGRDLGAPVGECAVLPTSEASFHSFRQALHLPHCRAGAANASLWGSPLMRLSTVMH